MPLILKKNPKGQSKYWEAKCCFLLQYLQSHGLFAGLLHPHTLPFAHQMFGVQSLNYNLCTKSVLGELKGLLIAWVSNCSLHLGLYP